MGQKVSNSFMIRLFIFICCLSVVFSCRKEERPKDILTPEEMVASLTELYIVEAKVSSIPAGRDSSLQLFDYFEKKTFEKLNFTDSIFKKSYSYYLDRPKELEEIYTVVIDSLNLWEQQSDNPTSVE